LQSRKRHDAWADDFLPYLKSKSQVAQTPMVMYQFLFVMDYIHHDPEKIQHGQKLTIIIDEAFIK